MISKAVKNIDFNFKPSIFDNIRHWFTRKYRQIKKLIRYIPVIWKSFDFDYHYAIDIFQMQLEDIANEMESDRAMTLDAKINASKIRTAIRLMKKVYDEDYGLEYQKKVEDKYGKHTYKFEPIEDSDNSLMVSYYDGKKETEEIEKFVSKELRISNKKQMKAHRILWKYIEHNIQYWWD